MDSFGGFPKHITVIGVGLIGGSLSLAIKKRFAEVTITGVDKPTVLRKARRLVVIDRAEPSLHQAVANADLVVLATPVGEIMRLLPDVAKHCPPGTIVTDVGSVKEPIMRLAARYFRNGNFVGGHPLAGSERGGVEAAQSDLLENATYVLCPLPTTPRPSISKLRRFISYLGARPLISDAHSHDGTVATLSNLPQLLAVGIANVAGTKGRELKMSGGGLRDMTRLASSPFDVWEDILSYNRANIKKALRILQTELSAYEHFLRDGKMRGMKRKFARARRVRQIIKRSGDTRTLKQKLSPS